MAVTVTAAIAVTAATRRPARSAAATAAGGGDAVSFEDAFDAEVREEFGDLGPSGRRAAAAVAVAAAAAASAAAGAAAGSAPLTDPILPGHEAIEQTDLANGLRIVTETMPEARSVTLGFWVGVGGRDEPAALSGASHFLEHLLFKGTEDRSARAIAESVDAVGGEMNAFTAAGAHRVLRPAARTSTWPSGCGLLGDVAHAHRRSAPSTSTPSAR